MAAQRIFTLSQVAQHKSTKDCWLVIHGRVLDVTKFLASHPGGEDALIEVAGKDATKEFDDTGHSGGAKNLLREYQVGVLQGHTIKDADSKDVSIKKKEMSAFVIKGDPLPKSKAFLEFFVPLLFAAFYFGYRYLTRADQITS
ncbi:cytochrome b5-like [Senna tora]|uniref:Cytochrome b5-like n=1 Tax=Senna tora TaxID=362788 RepID=A0A834TXV3_9FABA|nr:cytochrome b5-like [Senna tora]